MMRVMWRVLMVVSVSGLCACSSDNALEQGIPAGGSRGTNGLSERSITPLDMLPADNEVESWVRNGPPVSVDDDVDLYNMIDGGAPKYIDRGWLRSAYGAYSMGLEILQVAVHDMGSGQNAEEIFNYDLPVSRIEIQADLRAVVDTGLLAAYRSQAFAGQYYVEVTIDDRSDAALVSITAFTQGVLQRIAAVVSR
jgi:hypothetical protein